MDSLHPTSRPFRAQLFAIGGPLKGQTYSINDEIVIGRDPNCQIRINDPKVSRRHTRVDLRPSGEIVLTDLQSKNGSVVDGRLVLRESLKSGAQITVGPVTFLFQLSTEDVAPTSVRPFLLNIPEGPVQERTLDGS